MSRLLHVSSSPRRGESESLALAEVFLDAYTAKHPEVEVERLDLWQANLPAFGFDSASAKMAVFGGGEPAGNDQVSAWEQARAIFDRFAAADAYLFSVPMWNAGVPYILKQWIDIITQPGWAFGFDPEAGYTGLIQGKKATTIYTSGVHPAFGQDFQRSFFDDWLRFIGITDITEIRFQPTVLTANPDEDRAAAQAQARDAAKAF